MKQIVNVDLTNKTTDWAPPVLTFGEELTLALYFTKNVNGNSTVPNLTFTGGSAMAAIGVVDARPLGGQFALQIGDDPGTDANTTALLQYDDSANALAAAINAVPAAATYGTVVVQKVNGSWLLHFGTGAVQVPLKVVKNGLSPISVGRLGAWQVDHQWVHEVRLVQGAVAFSSSYDTVLPEAPTVTEIRAGGSSGSDSWNELQQLYLPPDFQGAYTIQNGFQRTPIISPDAGPADIQAALNTIGNGFNVTLPLSYHFLIEFVGDFAGQAHSVLTIEVEQSPPGPVTLTLPLNTAELASALRVTSPITLPLELRITCKEDTGDYQELVPFVIPVTIQRPLIFPSLEETPQIDWLHPFSPKSYVPFGSANVVTTGQIYATNAGDGSATSFSVTHGLATSDVFVFVRDNSSGYQLVDGTDFTAKIDNANSVTLTALHAAPGTEQWRVLIVKAQTTAQWASELTVTEAQVRPGMFGTSLEDDLIAINSRLNTLETLLPAGASTASASTEGNAFTIAFQPGGGILFARDSGGHPITDPKQLPARGAYLLPAINSSSTSGALPGTLPAPSANALYTTSAATLIPGGGHIRSSMSAATGFVGSDGRMLYPVTRSGSKDSYFPTPFELTLWEAYINDKMFSPGTTLTALFGLALQLLNANTEAQWVVAIEQGTITEQVSGSSYDSNLLDVTWNTATPLVLQRLLLTSALETHTFGCTISSDASTVIVTHSLTSNPTVTVQSVPARLIAGSSLLGSTVLSIDSSTSLTLAANASIAYSVATPVPFSTLTANGLYYQRIIAANSAAPASANFALRARLFNFDTKNSVTDARGWVSWALANPTSSGTLGIVIG